jgi:CubicO group peptidase (beta-lactamase class C family)
MTRGRSTSELRSAAWAERATVRDLLANRSRLPLSAQLEFSFSVFEDDDEALSRLAVKAATGEQTPPVWSYTNTGWCLLGRAIETLTGLAWEEAMKINLFAPTGMHDTTFATKPGAEPCASGHEITAERRCNSNLHAARRTTCPGSAAYTRGPIGAGK